MSGGYFDCDYYGGIGRTAETFDGAWEDREINQLFHDLFVEGFGHRDGGLVVSLDLYKSGDIGEEDYKEQVKAFKKKWFRRTAKQTSEFYQNELQKLCDELKTEIAETIE